MPEVVGEVRLTKFSTREILKNGKLLQIRAVEPEDKSLLQEEFRHLSAQSIYFRFFGAKNELSEKELKYFTEIDFRRHVGLMAILEDDGKMIPVGVARYIVADKDLPTLSAEIAFAVEDEYQGIGIGKALLKHLSIIARRDNLRTFYCYVLAENVRMLSLLESSELPIKILSSQFGTYEISIAL